MRKWFSCCLRIFDAGAADKIQFLFVQQQYFSEWRKVVRFIVRIFFLFLLPPYQKCSVYPHEAHSRINNSCSKILGVLNRFFEVANSANGDECIFWFSRLLHSNWWEHNEPSRATHMPYWNYVWEITFSNSLPRCHNDSKSRRKIRNEFRVFNMNGVKWRCLK